MLELALLPAQSAAALAFFIRLHLRNRPAGVSGTAYIPLLVRLLLHAARTRDDEAALRLAAHLPALSKAEVSALGSAGWAARRSGYEGAFFGYPREAPSSLLSLLTHRTGFFDRALDRAMHAPRRPMTQLVVLGAGFDTRAYRLAGGPRIYEVDTPATQRAKRAAVQAAGLEYGHVTYVETDFNQRSWFDALLEAGLDARAPTFILWEGVTMYLDRAAVDATLSQVPKLAPGSRIAFDYFSAELVQARPPFSLLGRLAQAQVGTFGERFSFGISTQPPPAGGVLALLAEHGLTLEQYEPFGHPEAAWGGLATAVAEG